MPAHFLFPKDFPDSSKKQSVRVENQNKVGCANRPLRVCMRANPLTLHSSPTAHVAPSHFFFTASFVKRCSADEPLSREFSLHAHTFSLHPTRYSHHITCAVALNHPSSHVSCVTMFSILSGCSRFENGSITSAPPQMCAHISHR